MNKTQHIYSDLSSEKGSMVFYILITIGMLAALSYAVLQSSRSNVSNLTQENIRSHAVSLLDYTNAVAYAVADVRINGALQSEICFDSSAWTGSVDYDHAGCDNDSHKIFHVGDGSVIWQLAPLEALDINANPDRLWRFSGSDHIQDVGSCTGGADCAELILTLKDLREDICIRINDLLDIENPDGDPPTEVNLDLTPFQGSYSDGQTIGAGASSPIAGKKAACIYLTTPETHLFYRVLQVR